MMPLATDADVHARLGRALTDDEAARAVGLLDEASILVAGYCGRDFARSVPDAVRVVVSRIVARSLGAREESAGLESTQLSAGPFQMSRNYTADSTAGGPWLTRSDKTMLRRYRAGAFSVATW